MCRAAQAALTDVPGLLPRRQHLAQQAQGAGEVPLGGVEGGQVVVRPQHGGLFAPALEDVPGLQQEGLGLPEVAQEGEQDAPIGPRPPGRTALRWDRR